MEIKNFVLAVLLLTGANPIIREANSTRLGESSLRQLNQRFEQKATKEKDNLAAAIEKILKDVEQTNKNVIELEERISELIEIAGRGFDPNWVVEQAFRDIFWKIHWLNGIGSETNRIEKLNVTAPNPEAQAAARRLAAVSELISRRLGALDREKTWELQNAIAFRYRRFVPHADKVARDVFWLKALAGGLDKASQELLKKISGN
ncbi:MAG: hypothetical protein HY401_07990 [Elusimicrobia bacterium]|nr:hypothetical protein [Elusimicrobiota bacterium]